MLPVSTAPNAIASAAGGLKSWDMVILLRLLQTNLQILGHGHSFKIIAKHPSNPGTLRRLLLTELEPSAVVKILQPCFMWPEILLCKHWLDWQCYQTMQVLVGAPLTLLTMAATVGWTTLTGVFCCCKEYFWGRMFHRDYNDPNWSCFSLVIFYIDFPKH